MPGPLRRPISGLDWRYPFHADAYSGSIFVPSAADFWTTCLEGLPVPIAGFLGSQRWRMDIEPQGGRNSCFYPLGTTGVAHGSYVNSPTPFVGVNPPQSNIDVPFRWEDGHEFGHLNSLNVPLRIVNVAANGDPSPIANRARFQEIELAPVG